VAFSLCLSGRHRLASTNIPEEYSQVGLFGSYDKGNLFTLSVLTATAKILNRYLNFED